MNILLETINALPKEPLGWPEACVVITFISAAAVLFVKLMSILGRLESEPSLAEKIILRDTTPQWNIPASVLEKEQEKAANDILTELIDALAEHGSKAQEVGTLMEEITTDSPLLLGAANAAIRLREDYEAANPKSDEQK